MFQAIRISDLERKRLSEVKDEGVIPVAMPNEDTFGVEVADIIEITDELQNEINDRATKDDLSAHISDKENPHETTKKQVGLEHVDNVRQATKTEFVVHDEDDVRHITEEERDRWDKKSIDVYDHVNNKNNPHEVTKSQVGLANVENVRQASKAEFDTHDTDNVRHLNDGEREKWNEKADSDVVSGLENAMVSHINNRDNPHDTTKSQIGLGNVDNVQQATKTEFTAHDVNNDRHINSGERTIWNSKADGLGTVQAGTGTTRTFTTQTNVALWTFLKTIWDRLFAVNTVVDTKADNSALTTHTGNSTIHVTQENKDYWNSKQNQLNRTITIHTSLVQNTGNTITDTGGNLQLPAQVNLTTPTENQVTLTDGFWTIGAIAQSLLNNVTWLFANKQNKLNAGTNIQITNNTISATDTVYTHPAHTARGTVDLTGAQVYNRVQVDNQGHVTNLTTRTLTAANIGAATSEHSHTIANVTNLQTTLDGKQNALNNRTVGGNDNATGTVQDNGGNLSVPIPVTLTATSATNTQNTATTAQTLRTVLVAFRNNLRWIFDRIPTSSSATNQLATTDFVNSSIQDIAANYITPTTDPNSRFTSLAALRTGGWFHKGQPYPTPTKSDYAFYINADDENSTWRGFFDGATWIPLRREGEKAFTDAQWKAINSGIIAENVEKLAGIQAGAQVNPLRGDVGTGVLTQTATVGSAETWAASNHTHALPATVTQANAEAGTETTIRMWTAQRVRQAINAVTNAINTALNTHIGRTDNPHSVTAVQIDAAPAIHRHSLGTGASQVDAAAANHRHAVGTGANQVDEPLRLTGLPALTLAQLNTIGHIADNTFISFRISGIEIPASAIRHGSANLPALHGVGFWQRGDSAARQQQTIYLSNLPSSGAPINIITRRAASATTWELWDTLSVAGHTHEPSEVGAAPATHTHPQTDVTNFALGAESIQTNDVPTTSAAILTHINNIRDRLHAVMKGTSTIKNAHTHLRLESIPTLTAADLENINFTGNSTFVVFRIASINIAGLTAVWGMGMWLRGADAASQRQIIYLSSPNFRVIHRAMATGTTWDVWITLSIDGHTHTRANITDFPATMPPSDHTHTLGTGANQVNAAAANHRHAVGTGANQVDAPTWEQVTGKPAIPAAANLSGQGTAAFGQAANNGATTTTTFSRSDHVHALPSLPATMPPSDHTHTLGTGANQVNAAAASVTRTNTTSTQSPAFGATVTMIDGVTTNAAGQVTGANTKTVTLPAAQTLPTAGTAATNFVSGNQLSTIDNLEIGTRAQALGYIVNRTDEISTLNFILTLRDAGAFATRTWSASCQYTHANQPELNTGIGRIKFSGAFIEVMTRTSPGTGGADGIFTIRITTGSHTSNSNIPHVVFLFTRVASAGADTNGVWQRVFNVPRTGTTAQYIRGDGSLATMPTIPSAANIDTTVLTTTASHGTGTDYARANHRHALPERMPPTTHTHTTLNDLALNITVSNLNSINFTPFDSFTPFTFQNLDMSSMQGLARIISCTGTGYWIRRDAQQTQTLHITSYMPPP